MCDGGLGRLSRMAWCRSRIRNFLSTKLCWVDTWGNTYRCSESRTRNVKSSAHSTIKSEPKALQKHVCLFVFALWEVLWTDIELLDKPASAVPKSEVKNSPRPLPPKCVVWELEPTPVQVAVENLPSTVGLAQRRGSWASHRRWKSLGCFTACARWARSQMPWVRPALLHPSPEQTRVSSTSDLLNSSSPCQWLLFTTIPSL